MKTVDELEKIVKEISVKDSISGDGILDLVQQIKALIVLVQDKENSTVQSLKNLQYNLLDIPIIIKYLLFDLEATKRIKEEEIKDLKKSLEELEKDYDYKEDLCKTLGQENIDLKKDNRRLRNLLGIDEED